MKHIILFSFIFINISFVNAGNEDWSLGGKQAGMGFSGVTLSDVWSSSHNQAGLARLTSPCLGLYSENRFILKELSLQAFSFAVPTKEGTFALDLSYFGYALYNETKIGLAYGLMLGDKFSIGAKIDYLNTHFAETYGNKGTVIAELGFLFEPTKNLFIGGHLYNLTRSKIAAYDNERIPSTLTFGIGYRFTQKLYMATEAEKDLLNPIIYKVGFDYNLVNNVFLRGGVTTSADYLTFGLGYALKKIRVDVSFSYHHVLGFSPHIGFLYNFKYNTPASVIN
jgi:hypothetical protein